MIRKKTYIVQPHHDEHDLPQPKVRVYARTPQQARRLGREYLDCDTLEVREARDYEN